MPGILPLLAICVSLVHLTGAELNPLERARITPGTNTVPLTRVHLERVQEQHAGEARLECRIVARPTGETACGWIVWKATLIDSNGAQSPRHDWMGPGRLSIPLPPRAISPYNVLLQGREILSAGRIELPSPGQSQMLIPMPRTREYGMRKVFLLGKGGYRITRRGELEASPIDRSSPRLELKQEGEVIEADCPHPAILLVEAQPPPGFSFSARFRERPTGDRGMPLTPNSSILVTNRSSNPIEIVQLHSFRPIPGGPLSRHPLEAEILVDLPPMTFRIETDRPLGIR